MKDTFDIHKWNRERYLAENKKELNEFELPSAILTKYAANIKNAQTFASAILGLINTLAEKENESIMNNPKLKRAISFLEDLAGDEQEASQEEPVAEGPVEDLAAYKNNFMHIAKLMKNTAMKSKIDSQVVDNFDKAVENLISAIETANN